jgi:hypothetical protein
MASSEANTSLSSRGTKRKLSVHEVRLTPSQRLAAARKAAKLAEPAKSGLADDDESNVLGSETSRGQAGSKRDDEYYRNIYATDPDFAALGEQDGEFGAW